MRGFLVLLPLAGCETGIHQLNPKVEDSATGDSATGDSADVDADSDADADADADADTDTDADADPAPVELTLLSLNLHCFKLDGTSFPDNDARFAAIAEAAANAGVTALAVQEACENDTEGVAITRLADALGAATGDTWGSAWTPTHLAWTGTADEAQEGIGLLTTGGDPTDVATWRYAVQGTQERWLLSGTDPATGVRLTTVHLDYDDPSARLAQTRESAQYALVHAPSDWRTIVAGDWNAIAADPALDDLAAAGFDRLSAAADPDGTHIDHVWAPSPAAATVLSTRALLDGTDTPWVSDHPGVLVQVRFDTAADAVVTRFAATYDTGVGHYLALRGDTAPLDWDSGWPAINTASDRWEATVVGWPSGHIAHKWLVDDTTWQTGDDLGVDAGATSTSTPSF